mmetsp:Transcript_7292/g.16809  ORF Transcript_7292/g.16809 Transcript_7292/m.16809 type:complete len:187 (+) Transcript_7292:349-909(+)
MIIVSRDGPSALEQGMQILQNERHLLYEVISEMNSRELKANKVNDDAAEEVMKIIKAQMCICDYCSEESQRKIGEVMARVQKAGQESALQDLEPLKTTLRGLKADNKKLADVLIDLISKVTTVGLDETDTKVAAVLGAANVAWSKLEEVLGLKEAEAVHNLEETEADREETASEKADADPKEARRP